MNHLFGDRHRLALSVAFWLMVFTSTGFSEEGVWRITGTPGSRCNRVISCGDSQRVLWDLAGSDALYPAIGRSTDGGESWTRVRCMPDGEFRSAAGSRSDPPELYYLTDVGLFRFDSSSNEWLTTGPGGLEITMDPNHSCRLILETTNVTLESTDSGGTWHRYGIPGFEIDHVRFALGHSGAMVCSDRERNDILFSPGDSQFRHLGFPLDTDEPFILHLAQDQTIYFSTQNQLFRYDYSGTSWEVLSPLPTKIIGIDSADGVVLATLPDGFRISRNRGVSWMPVLEDQYALDVEVNQSEIFLGSYSGMWVSRDDMEHLSMVQNRIALASYWDLCFDSREPYDIYLSGELISRSTDDGDTWTHLDNLPGGGFGTLKQSSYIPEVWYLISDSLYYSDDDMQNWINIGWDYPDYHGYRYVGIRADRKGVFMSTGSYDTQDGPDPYTNIYCYDPLDFDWSAAWTWGGLTTVYCGEATSSFPFAFTSRNYSGGYQIYVTVDGFETLQPSSTLVGTVSRLFPIRDDPDELILIEDDRLMRYNWMTGVSFSIENITPRDVTFVSSNDYFLGDCGVSRADADHIEPIPVGDITMCISRVFSHPRHPLRVYALLSSGGLASFDLHPEAPILPAPSDFGVDWVDDHHVSIHWQPSDLASGARLHCSTPGTNSPEIHTFRGSSGHERLSIDSIAQFGSSAVFRLSEYDAQGREGGLSEPVTVPIGQRSPRVMLVGTWNTRLTSDSGGSLQVTAFVSDRQGLDTIQSVELLVDGIPSGAHLHDDGLMPDMVAHDGLFSLNLDLTQMLAPNLHLIGITATDNEGFTGMNCSELTVH